MGAGCDRYECDVGGVTVSHLVFMSSDVTRLSARWSKHRVELLGRAIGVNDDTLAVLKTGK